MPPTALSEAPPKAEAIQKVNIEYLFRQTIFSACLKANVATKHYEIEIRPAPASPKSVIEFSLLHISDDHPVGFIRAFAFVPKTMPDPQSGMSVLKGFMAMIRVHIDEENFDLALDENLTLATDAEREILNIKISTWVAQQIEKWAKK